MHVGLNMKLVCQGGIKVSPGAFKHWTSEELRTQTFIVNRRFYKDMNPRGLEKKSNFELLE